MGKRNLTVQLDDLVVRHAKILAARRGTSVSSLVAHQIEELVENDARYSEAMEEAIRAMKTSKAGSGGRTWRREELYDR